MTDVVEKHVQAAGLAIDDVAVCDEPLTAARAALATLTPGSTWTTEDGVEVMVVPVEAARGCLAYLEAMDARELGVWGMKARASLADTIGKRV